MTTYKNAFVTRKCIEGSDYMVLTTYGDPIATATSLTLAEILAIELNQFLHQFALKYPDKVSIL